MTLKIMFNKSEKAKLTKTTVELLSLTGTLREGSSLIDPVILVEGLNQSVTVDGVTYAILTTANYAYIADFGRYYFITNIETDSNGLFKVSMHVDVLMSYNAQIKTQKAIIKRQEGSNAYNKLINDGSFKVYADPVIETKSFSSGLTAEQFVLAVAGSN